MTAHLFSASLKRTVSITLRLMMIAFFIFSALAIQPAPPAAAAPLGDERGMPDPTGEVPPEAAPPGEGLDGMVEPLAPDLAWRAYNDCNTNIGTAPGSNVTTYTVTGSTTGLLRSYPGGTNTPVTVTFSSFNNPTRDDQGISPNAGTDAYNVFNGIVDLAGGIWYGSTGWWVDVTFTGLDPAKTYTFVTTANRNEATHTNRYSKFTIRDLTSAANESTSGVAISTTSLTGDTSVIWTGYNTVNGYVARWIGINPGADGDFTVRAESNMTEGEYRAYGPSGFMLGEEVIPPTTVTYQQGVGSYTGTRDTTLKSNSPTTNYGSQAFLEWDTDAAPGAEMALLQFADIFGSGAGQIPPGSTITSASLRYRTYSNTTSYGSNGNFYESLVSWDEASTYNTFGGEAGVQADEYFSTQVASGSAAANNTNYTVNVTSSLQRWSSGTAANFGWVILSAGSDGVEIHSREATNSDYRPLLTVTYIAPLGPTITASGTLSAFSSTPGTPSAAQTYTVSGSNLTEGILITPPAGFELSTDGTNYHPTLTLPQSGGTVGSTTIHVRLNSLTEGSFSGNITHTSAGATQRDVAVSGTVITPLTEWIAYNDVAWSTGQTTTNITTYTDPGDGTSSGLLMDYLTGRSTGVTATLTESGGPYAEYSTYGGTETAVGTDAYTTFHGFADMPGVIHYGSTTGWWLDVTFTNLDPARTYTFATSANRAGGSGYLDRVSRFTITGVDAATNASTAGTTISPSGDYTAFPTGENTSTGYVARWTGIQPGADGTFTIRSQAHGTVNQAYAFSVFLLQMENTAPTITTAGTLTAFSTTPGTPSAAQTYTVRGSNLTEGILITPPAGFELSTDGTNYHPTLTLPQSGGTVGSTTIHVRLNSLTEGSFSGNITHTSAGATQRVVAVSGTTLLCLTVSFQQGTNSYSGAKDTWLSLANPTNNYGGGTYVLVDGVEPNTTGDDAVILLYWDLSSLPSGVTVQSASIDVNVTNASTLSFPMFDMLQSWTEGTNDGTAGTGASWNFYGAGSGAWPGGSPISASSRNNTTLATFTGTTGAKNFALNGAGLSVLQSWITNPASNFGFQLAHPTNDDSFQFTSKEGTTVANRPKLNLTYCAVTAPTITTAGTLTAFSTTPGTPSAAQTYTVSGSNLTEGILITPPAGFELSTDGTNYHPTLTLPQSGGTVGSTTIHIRLTGAVGTYSGNITHTSAGATQRDVAVSGDVSNCQTVSLEAVDDNYISNYSTSTNNNYGASTTLKVTRDADNNRAAFFRWDLSAIPGNATVDTVSLSLYISTAASQTYNLYNMRRNWVEGTGASSVSGDGATWLTYDGSLNWTTPGASSITLDRYDTNLWSAGTTSFSTTGTKTETFNTDGEAVVQGWINGSGFNYGLTLQNYSTSTSLNDDLQFASSENTTNAGPTLNVSYCMPITCYALTLSHTGDGTTPSASPANSSGCAAGSYISGESITLSGAVPASGWEISNWTGTSNNSSTASSNSLVMPASNYAAGVNYRVINASPNLPVLVQPADDATGISTSPTLEVTASDPNAGDTNLTVNFYGRPAGGTTGADFTLIAIPDTQNEAQSYPTVMLNQLDWIELGTPDNIVFATGLGDIVNTYSSATQYNNADAAYDRLDLAGVPYTVSPGNHDTGAGSLYETYFGVSRFTGKSWYQGHYGSDNNNNYSFFSASGNDFILINLQYSPGTAQLDWADALLKANPTRRGIVVQHDILNIDNNFVNSTSYNALRDNPNLFLMLCGHMHSASDGSAYRAETGTDGHTIHILMTDYQDYPNGGNGYLRLLRFSPAVDKIYASIYSPTIPGSLTSAANYEQFEMVYDLNGSTAASYTLIGTTTAANGGNASVTWAGLSDNTEYEWYATVSDATLTTTGPTWSFTTGSAASTHTIPLEQGWNLISFNLHPADTSITSVLASVAGSYDLVYAWDASVTMNNWSHYAPGAGAGNTLTSLDAHQGFWIHMTAADTLEVSGTPPTTTNITLYPTGGGWNLVGYPSAASQALPGVLSNHGVDEANLLIFAYHPADTADPWKMYDRLAPDYANDLPALTPGGGYWIKVGTTLRTWTVAY